jgi:hypothetical protein
MVFHTRDWPTLATTAIVGGLAGGLVMGAILQAGTDVLATIGQVSGSPDPLVGWALHLLLSVVFAVGFLLILGTKPIEAAFGGPLDTVLLAIVYSAFLASVTWGFVIPIALGFEEVFPLDQSPDAASVALFSIVLGIAHFAYGIVLAGVVIHRHRPLPLFEEDSVDV